MRSETLEVWGPTQASTLFMDTRTLQVHQEPTKVCEEPEQEEGHSARSTTCSSQYLCLGSNLACFSLSCQADDLDGSIWLPRDLFLPGNWHILNNKTTILKVWPGVMVHSVIVAFKSLRQDTKDGDQPAAQCKRASKTEPQPLIAALRRWRKMDL